jgi:hypothetical protein
MSCSLILSSDISASLPPTPPRNSSHRSHLSKNISMQRRSSQAALRPPHVVADNVINIVNASMSPFALSLFFALSLLRSRIFTPFERILTHCNSP